MVIPTNRPLQRIEEPDLVYRTEREKYEAIVNDILEKQASGRPTLVGTVSIEKSERLSVAAEEARHQARRPERQVPRAGSRDRRAGRPQGQRHDRHQHGRPRHRHPARRQRRAHGAAAGACRGDRREAAEGRGEVRRRRGVRLLLPRRRLLPRAAAGLGAHLRALQAADRGRARRGRERSAACTSSAPSATRRGASTTSCAAAPAARAIPGSSRFYLSLEDDLMRIFGSDRISGLMQRLGMEEGVPIEHGMVTQRHRARAEAGRGAELLRPQAPARVRRRDEQAA